MPSVAIVEPDTTPVFNTEEQLISVEVAPSGGTALAAYACISPVGHAAGAAPLPTQPLDLQINGNYGGTLSYPGANFTVHFMVEFEDVNDPAGMIIKYIVSGTVTPP